MPDGKKKIPAATSGRGVRGSTHMSYVNDLIIKYDLPLNNDQF